MARRSVLCNLCAKLTISWLELSSDDREFSQQLLSCAKEDAPLKVCKKCYYKLKDVREFIHESQQGIALLKENAEIKMFVDARASTDTEEKNSQKSPQKLADSEDIGRTSKSSFGKKLKRISYSSASRKEEDDEDTPLIKRKNSSSEISTLPKEVPSETPKDHESTSQSSLVESLETLDTSTFSAKSRRSSNGKQNVQETPPVSKRRSSRAKPISEISSPDEPFHDDDHDFSPRNVTQISSRPRRENTLRPKKYFDENMDVTMLDSDEEKVPRSSTRRSAKIKKEMEVGDSESNDANHDTTVYPEDQPYQCELCSTCCNNKALFVQHLRQEHPEIPEGVIRTIEGDSSKNEMNGNQNERFCDRCNMRLSKTSPSEIARHYKSRACRDAFEALQGGELMF